MHSVYLLSVILQSGLRKILQIDAAQQLAKPSFDGLNTKRPFIQARWDFEKF